MSNSLEQIPENIVGIANKLLTEDSSYTVRDNYAASLEKIAVFCDLALRKYNAKKAKKRSNRH